MLKAIIEGLERNKSQNFGVRNRNKRQVFKKFFSNIFMPILLPAILWSKEKACDHFLES